MVGAFAVYGSLGGAVVAEDVTQMPVAAAAIAARIDDRGVSLDRDSSLPVPATAHTFTLGFKPEKGLRARFRLEGVDPAWREGPGEMAFRIRFANANGEQIDNVAFRMAGESAGWSGDLKNPAFVPRREKIVVPQGATSFWLEISSAGPPATLGALLVKDMAVIRAGRNGEEETLVRGPYGRQTDLRFPNSPAPVGFISDGPRPSMARLVTLAPSPGATPVDCLAIFDEDPGTHAEWHTIKQDSPRIAPGETLTVTWQEAFSVGFGDAWEATYFPPQGGEYRFRLQQIDTAGLPLGGETAVMVRVLTPWWERWWVLAAALVTVAAGAFAITRHVTQRRMRQQLLHLEENRSIEQERLRFARDIHDTLAQGFTGVIIQLEAAEDAQLRGLTHESTRHLHRAQELARDSLQEARRSVRALRPQALERQHLCAALSELVDKMTAGIPLEASFRVEGQPPAMPPGCEDNLLRICQEVLTNTLRHAEAKHFDCVLTFALNGVILELRDDGRGFDSNEAHEGFGLLGIKERIQQMDGELTIRSAPGEGTQVRVRLPAAQLKPVS